MTIFTSFYPSNQEIRRCSGEFLHWLSSGLGQGPGPRPGRMGCMVLCRTFHTAPEQGQGRMGYVPIFGVLKLFQVVCFKCISMAYRCPVLVLDTASVKDFCTISLSVLVVVQVLETASVITPSFCVQNSALSSFTCTERECKSVPDGLIENLSCS